MLGRAGVCAAAVVARARKAARREKVRMGKEFLTTDGTDETDKGKSGDEVRGDFEPQGEKGGSKTRPTGQNEPLTPKVQRAAKSVSWRNRALAGVLGP